MLTYHQSTPWTNLRRNLNWYSTFLVPENAGKIAVCKMLAACLCLWVLNIQNVAYKTLTHWDQDKMDVISQTTFSNVFSRMKMYEFCLRFNWSLFLKVQSTIFQLWFRYIGWRQVIVWTNKEKKIVIHRAHSIVSWPNPKQWVIVHTFDLMMIIRQSIYIYTYIFSQSSQGEWVNWKHTAPHIV